MAKAVVARNTVLLVIGEGEESANLGTGYEQWVEMSPVAGGGKFGGCKGMRWLGGPCVPACMHFTLLRVELDNESNVQDRLH